MSEAFRASYYRAFAALSDDALPAAIATHRLHEVLLWLAERHFTFAKPRRATLTEELRRSMTAAPASSWTLNDVARKRALSVATLRRRLANEGATSVSFVPVDLAPYRHSRAYLQRIGARPAYRRAMAKGDPDSNPLLA